MKGLRWSILFFLFSSCFDFSFILVSSMPFPLCGGTLLEERASGFSGDFSPLQHHLNTKVGDSSGGLISVFFS